MPNYNRHITSEKHRIALRNGLKEIKICDFCNCVFHSNFELTRHLKTKKHRLNANLMEKEVTKHICLNCDKEFAYTSGLSKHKKTCKETSFFPKTTTELSDMFTPQLFMDLLHKNTELQNMMMETTKEFKSAITQKDQQIVELIKSNHSITNNTNNNSNNTTNNNFNLNLFLNETCKDAINFSEFMNSIKVSIEDLENTGRLGYVEGISRIFVNALQNMEMQQRPLHCTDIKRETVYIKEFDKWEKENPAKENLKKAVDYIANKNLSQVTEWKKQNPECLDSTKPESDVLSQLYVVTLGNNESEEKTSNKIIHNLLKEVMVK